MMSTAIEPEVVVKIKNQRSIVWEHFTRIKAEDGRIKSKCKYCNKFLAGGGEMGTSSLSRHMKKCLNEELPLMMSTAIEPQGAVNIKNQRSIVWEHFTRIKAEDGRIKSKCKYCNKFLAGGGEMGTSSLFRHVKRHKQELASLREMFRQKQASMASPKSDLDCAQIGNASLHCSQMALQVKPIAEKPYSHQIKSNKKTKKMFSSDNENSSENVGSSNDEPEEKKMKMSLKEEDEHNIKEQNESLITENRIVEDLPSTRQLAMKKSPIVGLLPQDPLESHNSKLSEGIRVAFNISFLNVSEEIRQLGSEDVELKFDDFVKIVDQLEQMGYDVQKLQQHLHTVQGIVKWNQGSQDAVSTSEGGSGDEEAELGTAKDKVLALSSRVAQLEAELERVKEQTNSEQLPITNRQS